VIFCSGSLLELNLQESRRYVAAGFFFIAQHDSRWRIGNSNGDRRARCVRKCHGAGEAASDAGLTFDLYVAARSHAANEIVDHGPAIAIPVSLATVRPIGLLDSVSAIETVDIQ
jgi:hypothetical protein